ncbi:hypothetical protein [Sphingomonas sp. RS2018]
MMGWAALALSILAPPPQQSGAAGNDKVIVVTARSTAQTARELEACLARKCPSAEDIEASLVHAENQFIAGDYAGARHTLGQSRGRNMRFAAQLPVPVGDLARAYARMSAFDGRLDSSRIAQIDSLDALKAGLTADDGRVLAQRLLVADEFVRQGRIHTGTAMYDKIARQAVMAKLPAIQGTAMLRQAVLYSAIAKTYPAYRSAARQRIARIDATTDPALAPFREAMPLLRAHIAALDGDMKALDREIESMAAKPFRRPMLVFAPAIELDKAQGSKSGNVQLTGEARPQFIDVTFKIGRDGKVGEIETLRRTDTVSGTWPDRVYRALAGRRYAPIDAATDPALLRRTERFSMVFGVISKKETRIPTRSPIGRIVSLDLTPEPTPPSAT